MNQPKGKKIQRVTVHFTEDEHKALRHFVIDERVSMSEFIRRLVLGKIKQQKGTQ